MTLTPQPRTRPAEPPASVEAAEPASKSALAALPYDEQVAALAPRAPAARPAAPDAAAAPVADAATQQEAAPADAAPPDWRDALLAKRSGLIAAAKLARFPTADGSVGAAFDHAELEQARRHYLGELGLSDPAPAAAEAPAAAPPAEARETADGSIALDTSTPEEAPTAPAEAPKAYGDSAAADVKGFPAWFNAFQNHCIEASEWTRDHQVVQTLVTAFLNANDPAAPDNVKVFYDHVGKSEKNEQAGDLSYGASAKAGKGQTKAEAMKKTTDWCQQATSDAYAKGFAKAGYTFVPRTVSASMANQLGVPAGRCSNPAVLALWLARENPALSPPKDAPPAPKPKTSFWGAETCWGARLEAGDMVSFVSASHRPGMNGHVVTIVSAEGGDAQRAIRFVSGNAGSRTAGSGCIRAEDGTWVAPPKGGIDYTKDRPKQPGELYIYSITKLSQLQPAQVDAARMSLDPAAFEAKFHMRYDPSLDERPKQEEPAAS